MRRDAPALLASIRRWVLVGLVLLTPVFFLWDLTLDPFLLPKVVLLAAGVAVAGSLRAAEVLLGRSPRPLPRVALPAAFVAVPALVAWAASDYRRWALLGEEARLDGLVPALLVLATALLLADAFRGDFGPPARAFVASAAVVALYEVVQSVGLDPFDVPIPEYAPSTVGQSNFVGGFLAIALPAALATWTSAAGAARAAAMAAAVVIVLGLVLAFSQGGWVAAAAGVALLAGLRLRERHRLAPAAGVLVAAGLALASVGVVVLGLLDPEHPAVPSTARARGLWWQSAVSMGAESPVWGHGPNVYAIEGPHHRVAADALAHDTLVADAPHSVPLAVWADRGLLGVAGFVAVFVWVARRVRGRPGSPLRDAFAAGVAAYLVQSLVSVDSPLLQLALWVCVAGAAAGTEDPVRDDQRVSAGSARRVAAVAVAVAVPAATLWWGGRMLSDDAQALGALEDSSFARHDEAVAAMQDVLGHRSWEPYRRQYGLILGTAALDAGAEGRDELGRTKAAYAYLGGFPNVQAIAEYAGILHQWSIYDVNEEEAALAQLERQLSLDEHSPSARIAAAEALLRLGRSSEAVDVLEFLLPEMRGDLAFYARQRPGLWGALAVAYFLDGRAGDAEAALEDALGADEGEPPAEDCHVLVAQELLRTSGRGATRDEYLESSSRLFACEPATLALLPGYDPQDEER